MTERIKKRLEALFDMKNEAFFYERMTLLEEAFALYGKEAPGRRYAHAFYYLLDHMTIVIYPGEILVGAVKEIIPTQEQEEVFQKIVSVPGNVSRFEWKCSFESLYIQEPDPSGIKYNPEWFCAIGHQTGSFPMLLKKGLGGIREEMRARLHDDDLEESQRFFYENGIIVCDAVENYARRIAKKARELAREAEGQEREDYLTVAKLVDRVPMHPAQSFHEAVQSVWLVHMIESNICGARDFALGRLDQYLYPYYQADVEKGVLTEERALEIAESLFIKMNEIIGYCMYKHNPKRSLCNHSVQYVYLSGHDEQGNDATNPLSTILLNAHAELKLQQPTLYIHYNEDIDPAFFAHAVEVVKEGRGDPAFYNDRIVIDALLNLGIPLEDARNFSHFGCNNISLASMEDDLREIWNIVPKFVELAMNGGHCMQTGKVLTFEEKSDFATFEEFLDAVMRHYAFALAKALKVIAEFDAQYSQSRGFSFESLLIPYCVEHGVDMMVDTKYRHCNVHCCGLSTAGDELYAIDRLVFKEKRFTMQELCRILKDDWKGHETLYLEIKNKFPKYGNDDDVCDAYTTMFAERFARETMKQSPAAMPGPKPRILCPAYFSLDHAVPMGKQVAASANGRKNGEAISESHSPMYGTERNGPTALLNSVAKLPFQYTAGGCLNLKLQPSFVKGEKGTQTLKNLITGYFKKGGQHIQIMITDRKTLEDAVIHPENHRHLLVRVTGYSAYFVTLAPHEQQQIIERTAFA